MPHAIMSSVTEVDGWCSVHSQADPHFVCELPPRAWHGAGRSGDAHGSPAVVL